MTEVVGAVDVSTSEAATRAPLHGRVAVLTGSTGGLGFAIAEGLAQAGCRIMLNGIEPLESIEPMRRELEDRIGVPVAYHEANVGKTSEVEGLVKATLERFGAIDILVNNAVVRHFSPIVDFPTEHWEAALAVNLSAAFHAIRLTLPHMRKRNFGRIFNMTSVYGSRGTTNRVDYVTTKAALFGLTRAVALENLDYDVTCHGICPGSVLTPGTDDRVRQIMVEEHLSREAAERAFLQGKQPSGRFVPTRSVTDHLVFLCGPVAREMTGAILPVEAGWLAS
jgi:3-hydroxybutyrate dehydrogenase